MESRLASAPSSGADFRMSSNLEDTNSAIGNQGRFKKSGRHYEFNNRGKLTDGAFLADVDKSIGMTNKDTDEWSPSAFQSEQTVRFSLEIKGGEANDSVETTQGCQLALKSTSQSKLIFGVKKHVALPTSMMLMVEY